MLRRLRAPPQLAASAAVAAASPCGPPAAAAATLARRHGRAPGAPLGEVEPSQIPNPVRRKIAMRKKREAERIAMGFWRRHGIDPLVVPWVAKTVALGVFTWWVTSGERTAWWEAGAPEPWNYEYYTGFQQQQHPATKAGATVPPTDKQVSPAKAL